MAFGKKKKETKLPKNSSLVTSTSTKKDVPIAWNFVCASEERSMKSRKRVKIGETVINCVPCGENFEVSENRKLLHNGEVCKDHFVEVVF